MNTLITILGFIANLIIKTIFLILRAIQWMAERLFSGLTLMQKILAIPILAIFIGTYGFYAMGIANVFASERHLEPVIEDYSMCHEGICLDFNLEPPTPVIPWKIVNLDRIVWAISMHETKGCTIGSGKTHYNPGGVMTWATGERQFKRYANCEEGYEDMKRIWSTHYGGLPDLKMAKKWSGNDRAEAWLRNFYHYYNE